MLVSALRPLYPCERTPITIEQETGWALGLVWTVWWTEKIISAGSRILDLSAHSPQHSINTGLQVPWSVYFEVLLPVHFHILGIFFNDTN